MIGFFEKDSIIEYERKDELNVSTVERGIVHPLKISETNVPEHDEYGGVTDAKLRFVAASATQRVNPPHFSSPPPHWYIGANPNCSLNEVAYVDEEVVFIGAFSKHYGHFILEGLARLWFYLDNNIMNCRAVYIATQADDNFLDVLYAFGLKKDHLVKINAPTQFRKVIIPEQSFRLQDSYHQKYKETIDQIQRNIPAGSYKKVFFSKERRNNNRGMGEKPIASVFQRNGYKVIYPEKTSMLKTLSILKGCDTFVASSGTNAHNAIFLNDQSTCICLNRSEHIHYVQTMINRMRNLNIIYVDAFFSTVPSNWSTGPFLFAPTKYLITFFKEQNFNFKERKLYESFSPFLLNFLIAWGIYYSRTNRANHIEDEETRKRALDFDGLVLHITNDLSHFQIDNSISRFNDRLRTTRLFGFLRSCRAVWRGLRGMS